MRKKKKVLIIHHARGMGGATISMLKLIRSLKEKDYEVKILFLKKPLIESVLKENRINYSIAESLFYRKYYKSFVHSEANYLKWYQVLSFINLSLCWLLSRFYFARKELENHSYDIVHLNSSVLTDWLAFARDKGEAIIHIREPFRNGRFDFKRVIFLRQMHKYASHIISISQDNLSRLGVFRNSSVIYNYADFPSRNPNYTSYSSKKVLYVGGAKSIKGFYTVVDSLDYLNSDIKVYFAGKYTINDKDKMSLKNIFKRLIFYDKKKNTAIKKINNHPKAEMIGFIKNINEYLDKVCCLISPFTVPHFSRPVIEAHLHKKPAIGTKVDGMDEIIEHEKNGILVPVNNSQALAKAINDLTSDSKKAKNYGDAGYKIAREKFSENNINQFIEVYDNLLFKHS